MPGRKQGGINNTRVNKSRRCPIMRMPIEYAIKGQFYAMIKEPLGSCQFRVETLNGDVRLAAPRGTIAKQGRLKKDEWVLIEPLSTNENGKYQIIFKYTKEQHKCLEKEGFLNKIEDPSKKESEEEDNNPMAAQEDDGFIFEGEEKGEEDMLIINDLFIDKI